jgi:hypothetical protein
MVLINIAPAHSSFEGACALIVPEHKMNKEQEIAV